MTVDAHTHIFPDALAAKAIPSLEATAKLKTVFDGTADGLIALMDSENIDMSFVLNTVTNERQVGNVNAFALETIKKHGDRLIPFCSLHPLTPDPKKELMRLSDAGIRGIKLHPDYVGYDIDSEEYAPLLGAICELGKPVVIHAGFDPVSPSHAHASPDAILRVLARFGGIKLIAAHFGGMMMWDEVAEKLCGKPVMFDTAFCCARTGMTRAIAEKLLDRHPHDMILFGSDAPWARPSEVLGFLAELGLSESSCELILHGNAEALIAGQR